MSFELPKNKIPATTQDPRNLIIMGPPKIGKTSIISTLDNCLHIDLEDGTDYVESMKVKVTTLKEWQEMCRAIKDAGSPYKFAAVDTVTALEEMAKPYALYLYTNSPQCKAGFNSKNVLEAPMGAGYMFLRQAMEEMLEWLSMVVPNIIIVGHIKDASISDSNDNGSVKELDLLGKTKRILSAKSDAIGYVHRDENSNLCINFGMGGEVYCGARPVHLANKDIIVAERQEDGSFISHWDRIYPSLA